MSLVSHRAAAVQAAHWAAFRRTYNGTATGIGPESFGYFDAAGNAKGWTYVSPGRREFCECRSSWAVTHGSHSRWDQTMSMATSWARQGESSAHRRRSCCLTGPL